MTRRLFALELGGTKVDMTPGLWLPNLPVAQPRSVAAVRAAVRAGDFLFCVCKADPAPTSPVSVAEELVPIGGICNVHALMEFPDQNRINIQLEIRRLGRLVVLHPQGECLVADVEELGAVPENYFPSKISIQAPPQPTPDLSPIDRVNLFQRLLGVSSHKTLDLAGCRIEVKFDSDRKVFCVSEIKADGSRTHEYDSEGQFRFEGSQIGRKLRENIASVLLEEIRDAITRP